MTQYNKIMVSLVGDDSEKAVVQQAVEMKNKLGASLVVIHVNDPHAGEMSMMMESPKEITEDMIRNQISEYGFGQILRDLEVIITENNSIAEAINEFSQKCDMLIVGHRKMSTFKSHIMDSVDEGIVNNTHCPVLVVQKD
ncbi:MAG: universal stress protein [Candidatus Marinimicrobia bacterium]|jgi:nucleotide-binding universal stress UspA family protein|nr:universal stress protein [Candidatus Neomarinimicrobiota bacterium]MBT3936604.1 universal stress protein [Candidatus Neomarinimicrobiota bacterium]MBT3961724.1 universal stress protein [Candidatus Neomarinimicrobiota bacterium]MBT4382815.1 universal stress protein [Candidatus Neomarinimicrobiota bacterium]MBT4635248.1 universal stress protein [Candidatus Neomarinimicrobiota bacterium]